MLKSKRIVGTVLVLTLLFLMTLVPVSGADTVSDQMASKISAYFDTFSSAEQTQIKATYTAFEGLTDAQWDTLVNGSGLVTAALIAKYDSEASAKTALKSLFQDTCRVVYSVSDNATLKKSCDSFVANQSATINKIFDGEATPDLLVAMIADAEKALSNADISGSVDATDSDLYKIAFGTPVDYVAAVDKVLTSVVSGVVAKNTGFAGKMTALGWEVGQFADLNAAVGQLVDSGAKTRTILYNSIVRAHSVLKTGTTAVNDGASYTLPLNSDMTFTFQIFGQNVSVPFGSNIKLPSNKEITVSTNKSSGKESFTVKGEKVISEYEMVIKRGSTSSDSLIEDSNTYITFKVTVTDGSVTPTATPTPTYIPGGGGTPAVINTPTPKPVDGSTSPVPSPSGTPSASVDPGKGGDTTADVELQSGGGYNYLVTLTSGEEEISKMENPYAVTIKLPYASNNGNAAVVTYTDKDGNQIQIKEAYYEDGYVYAKAYGAGTYTITDNNIAFVDIDGHWAQGNIQSLAAKGVVTGVGDNLFEPERNVTRAEFVRMLLTAFETVLPADATTEVTFTDVSADAWYAADVNKGAALGFVTGYPDETFRPDNQISREEMAVMVSKFIDSVKLDLKESVQAITFTDADDIGGWAANHVSRVQKMGIVNGMEDGRYAPQENTTRAQAATIIMGLIKALFQ